MKSTLEAQLDEAKVLLAEFMDLELMRIEDRDGQSGLAFASQKEAGRFVRLALQTNAFLKRLKESQP